MKKENLTREQLNRFDKDILITLLLDMQEQIAQQSIAMEKLTEQLSLMNMRTFGKKSENIQMDRKPAELFCRDIQRSGSSAKGAAANRSLGRGRDRA